jgi:hypothetical protein
LTWKHENKFEKKKHFNWKNDGRARKNTVFAASRNSCYTYNGAYGVESRNIVDR